MDTSETSARKRGRAPVGGVMGADIPTQSFDSTHGGVKQDTLGVGKGTREQAAAQGAEASDNSSTFLDTTLGGDAMDTSETLAGKRERARVDGLMDSDIPTQSAYKKSRLGDHHLNFTADKEVAKEQFK